MALFSPEKTNKAVLIPGTRTPDEVLFSADKYEENSPCSLLAAKNLASKAVEFANKIPAKLPEQVYDPIARKDWILTEFLPRLNTDYMKLEERKRVSTVWMCGILFQKHVVPRIITEVRKIDGKIDKSVLEHHSSDDRKIWVSARNKEWNIAWREGDWTCNTTRVVEHYPQRVTTKCSAPNFAVNPVCWRCGGKRPAESLDKTVWNLENLKKEDWNIFETAFPGELEYIRAYTENTGLSGWLLTNWFVAVVMYELFLIEPTTILNADKTSLQPRTEKQKTRRTNDLRKAWEEIEGFQISNLSGVFRLVERKFTTIEALFYAIATWYSSKNPKESREMKFVTNDYGKSARINLLDFCVSVPSEKHIKSIWSIFDALAEDKKTENLEEDKFEAALDKIRKKGVSYIDYLRNKYKGNSIGETNRQYLHRVITQKDTDFHLPGFILPRYEIFMNDAEYDDASCWLWKQFKEVEKSKRKPSLKPQIKVPTHLRNMPLYQNWTMNFILDESGKVFEWKGEDKRFFAWTESFTRNITMDATFLLNGKALEILQTLAHEFGHAMSMFGRHALQALFRPWARYFGENNPRQFNDRHPWNTKYSAWPDIVAREDKRKAEEKRKEALARAVGALGDAQQHLLAPKLHIKTLYSQMLALKLQIKTLRI